METNVNKSDDEICEIVSFSVGSQEFGIDIQSVREIRGWTEETVIPRAPNYVRGVINLRGAVLPIVDLAARLEMGASEPSARNVIIVTQINDQLVGLLVESVADILSVNRDQIQPTPDVASDLAKDFVRGVLPSEGGMLSLLEIKDILPVELSEAA